MKKFIFLLFLVVIVLFMFHSCERIEEFFSEINTTPTSETFNTTTSENTTEAISTSKTHTQTETTAVSDNEIFLRYIDILKAEQKNGSQKETTAFVFDGNGDGKDELFIIKAFASRAICDVFYIEKDKTIKAIDGYEIFNGNKSGYNVGIAVKDKKNYLFTYSKTTSGREYTVRYAFVDLITKEASTVAEDYRKHDSSTEKSIHEYTVNGESCSESSYIYAYESYLITYATEDIDKKGVQKIGKEVSELIKELESKLK